MGSLMALLFTFMMALLFEVSSVLGQDLKDRDALCTVEGCFVVYFQRKSFLDSWRACKEKGGNLATIKRKEDATAVATLFSTLDLRYSRTKVQVWIGLQRQPRQCSTARLLRGFSWTTGDQDTEYTNWQKEDSPNACLAPRCVVVGYNTQEPNDNLKWLDGPCSVPVDGYLCHYAYKGMCPALQSEGAGNAFYSTPFGLLSTLLTHVPIGSSGTVPCLSGTKEEQSFFCNLKEDGLVGWSRNSPLCSDGTLTHNWCDQNNGGCQHYCRPDGDHFYCECDSGYQLGHDGRSCELSDVCQQAPCQFDCVPLVDGYRCACDEGYMLAPDEHSCLDIDECLQSPCEQICVNALGTFECQCSEGYQLDEEGVCEDIDECITDLCEHACENTPGSHICHCHLGFSPVAEDPSRCQDTDECQIPGTCQQMCVNYDGGFECYCHEGYELMSDNYSCQKRGEHDDQSTVTPPFPRFTHQYPLDYWIHTDWPPEEDQTTEWLTDPPRVMNSDIVRVTSAPHDPSTQGTALDTTHSLTTSSSITPDLYEDDKEDTTTALPFLSTSRISEGAWNWWPDHSEGKETSHFPVEKKNYVEITLPQDPAVTTQLTPSQSPEVGDNNDNVHSVQEDGGQKQSITWLLVGLLVPICIIIVVMVALAIYCTRCSVQPRNKNTSDCYHWIPGAHDKEGAANPSAGVKTHV